MVLNTDSEFDCDDEDCINQGCPEHPTHDVIDHTYEQHHEPTEHVGDDECKCDVYLVSNA